MESRYCKLYKQLTDISKKTGSFIRLENCKGIVKEKTPKVKKISKQKEKTKFKKRLLSLWSKCIIKRDKVCQMCGGDKNLQAHHCIKTKAQGDNTSLDLSNGITLCFTCHLYKVHSGALYYSDLVKEKLLNIIGEDEYNRIKSLTGVKKFTIIELEELKKNFEDILKGTNARK